MPILHLRIIVLEVTHILLLFSCSVMSHSLWSHGLKHTRLPCPSLSSRVCFHSCPLSRWCPPTISLSFTPFSSYPQFFSASRCFPKSWLFASGSQSIGASASVSVLSMNIQGWFHLGWTGLLSLQSKGLESSLQHHISKASLFKQVLSLLYSPTLTSVHDSWKNQVANAVSAF